ncbi:MAG TPA: AmmeMemoRadiSam system protein B [Verrucomicrobiae bacterium]|nr:AmmeMemoRadiSam system protein B [Verrucomicrobiae bacterium]
MVRPPAVAGQFYPGVAPEVEAELDRLVRPAASGRKAIAVVCPHAGWMYSGHTAGVVYSSVQIPDRVILVGPNHHGIGSRYAVYSSGTWRTPIGDVPVAEPLASSLLDDCDLLAEDPRAHSTEHSLEVQLPMLLRANPNVHIVPLLIGGGWPEAGGRRELREIGAAIAETVREYGKPVLLVASTDLNHYEDQEVSHTKDKLVLDAVVNLDPEVLMNRVIEAEVSMCGVAATYVVLCAAKELGARHAELLEYRTSGDVSGDFARVVGYGGVVIE